MGGRSDRYLPGRIWCRRGHGAGHQGGRSDLPEVGAVFNKDDEAGVVESVKAASEVYAPIGGEILEVNDALTDNPALVNEDAEGDGWFFKMKIEDAGELDDLMTESEYGDFIED